ncbi:hypothetical protein AWB79_07355 [Caballeronia hypogeia]|uniref:Uncharacterized protein n=1 Tax=Caballeronia hypogeia TaxID=1777140 RepID=A0A158DQ44_9BURK|nr:hypothetical protein [Caballeronia hypogeia]SAK96613.1 hypothetical protein AWB79_07355 [Caballeronia hypogeia]
MYSMGAYFVEIIPQSVTGKGWTADARFSRQADYRKHAEVLKISYPSQLIEPTRALAERAVLQWAREFVKTSSEVIESSLRIQEETTNADAVHSADPAH